MPDGSVLLVDNVWYITKNIDMYMQICMHIYYCYIPYMNVLHYLVVIPGSSPSAATSRVKSAWHPSAGWTAWLATFLACLALWKSRTLCFSFTLTRCHMTIPMRSVCLCQYLKISWELNRIFFNCPLYDCLLRIYDISACVSFWDAFFFFTLGPGGSSGCCASVVNSQDAFYQLYLYTLQVRWNGGKPDDLWHWNFQ